MQVRKSILIEGLLMGVFWVLAVVGFICDEIVPGLESLRTYIMLGCDAVLVLLGLACLRHRADIVFIAVLALLCFSSSVIMNGLSLPFSVNGMRVFIGAMFIYPIFRYFMDDQNRREHFIKSFDKQLEYFLWLQVPCIAYQFIVYGAGDHGGGSLGNWYSGVISMLIYLISFYLLKKHINPRYFLSSIMNNFKYVLLLTPTFFNETKISFVLLVIYFILLMPIDKRMFSRAIIVMPLMGTLFIVGYTTYKLTYQGDVPSTAEGINIFSEDYLVEYVFSDLENAEENVEWGLENNESGVADVPRLTKFLLLPMFEEENPGHVLLGFGVGHFKGGTKMDHSDFFDQYEWYLVGTIPYLIHIYLQLGVVGVLLFITFLLSLFIRHPEGYSKRDLNLQLFLALLIGAIFFYAESLRDPLFCMVVYGLIACSWQPSELPQDATDDTADATEVATA